ncbi:Integrator complex subunit 2, partial [Nowakowskiella sp. JEL0078]
KTSLVSKSFYFLRAQPYSRKNNWKELKRIGELVKVNKNVARKDPSQCFRQVVDGLFVGLVQELIENPSLGDNNENEEIELMFAKIWKRMITVDPRELALKTVNLFVRENIEVNEMDIVLDPLILFKCDPRVFGHPELFDVLLNIIRVFLIISKQQLVKEFRTALIREKFTELSEVNVVALINAHELAVMQLLLQICLKKDNPNIEKIRDAACSFLHHMFIESDIRAKLLHFHGYDESLLEMTVEKIPSMHVCLHYIPEMISQPQKHKQLFAISLMSRLCIRYRIQKSLSIIQDDILPYVTKLAEVIHQKPKFLEEREIISVFRSMINFGKCFPVVAES